MSEATRDYERWTALMDRQAAGETLDAEELAFCERMAEHDEACKREQEMLEELGDLDSTPTERTRALVDATLARLEQEGRVPGPTPSVGRRRSRRRVALVWGSVAVAAAAAAMISVGVERFDGTAASRDVAQPPQRVEMVYASGHVLVDGVPVQGGTAMLDEGSRIEVGEGSACLAMDPGIDVCLAADSRLKLSRIHADWRRLDLERGRVGARLDKQPEGLRLSIVADDVWSTAVGTAFTVERTAGAAVNTTVLHGKVRVGANRSGEHLVGAHQRARVQGGAATLSAVGRSDEAPEWALLGPAELWRSPVSASLELQGAPTGAAVRLDGRAIGIAPLSTLVPVGNHRLSVVVDGEIAMRRDFVAAAGQRSVIEFVSRSTSAPTSDEQASEERAARAAGPRARHVKDGPQAAAPPSAAEMLSEARALMRAARWQEAASTYEALRDGHPRSREAHTVLVPLAQLELDRLDRPSAALGHAEAYLAAGPGALSQEARHTRIRALRALGRPALEREAIEEYLELHPRSFQAAGLRARLAELTDR